MKTIFEYKIDILYKEIEILQRKMADFDSIRFKIKGWAITLFSGLIFISVKDKNPRYMFICFLVIFAFWILDTLYKKYQHNFYKRYIEIENYLNSDKFSKSIEILDFRDFPIPNINKYHYNAESIYEKVKETTIIGYAKEMLATYVPMIIITILAIILI